MPCSLGWPSTNESSRMSGSRKWNAFAGWISRHHFKNQHPGTRSSTNVWWSMPGTQPMEQAKNKKGSENIKIISKQFAYLSLSNVMLLELWLLGIFIKQFSCTLQYRIGAGVPVNCIQCFLRCRIKIMEYTHKVVLCARTLLTIFSIFLTIAKIPS